MMSLQDSKRIRSRSSRPAVVLGDKEGARKDNEVVPEEVVGEVEEVEAAGEVVVEDRNNNIRRDQNNEPVEGSAALPAVVEALELEEVPSALAYSPSEPPPGPVPARSSSDNIQAAAMRESTPAARW